jgi:hypothetical protein
MFTAENLLAILNTQPFVPFRFVMSDGGSIEVRSREVVSIGRHFAVVGLLDPGATDTFFDRWAVVWYMHVSRVEFLSAGKPPFSPPGNPPVAVGS